MNYRELPGTARLNTEVYNQFSESLGNAFGFSSHSVRVYQRKPAGLSLNALPEKTPYWRIEFHSLTESQVIGFDIIGDAVIGRGEDAHIDFSQYIKEVGGISRRHAMLRSTPTHLYLLDLGSTNGTLVNGLLLRSSQARQLQDGDILIMGEGSFTLRVVGHTTIGEIRKMQVEHSEQTVEVAQNHVKSEKKFETHSRKDLEVYGSPEHLIELMFARDLARQRRSL